MSPGSTTASRHHGLVRSERCGSRDFEEFYAANYGKVAALVTAVTGDRDEADDVAQEAFTRALVRLRTA
jgi:DNA-directed RNA polymerase specialized sigma24 family protein